MGPKVSGAFVVTDVNRDKKHTEVTPKGSQDTIDQGGEEGRATVDEVRKARMEVVSFFLRAPWYTHIIYLYIIRARCIRNVVVSGLHHLPQ